MYSLHHYPSVLAGANRHKLALPERWRRACRFSIPPFKPEVPPMPDNLLVITTLPDPAAGERLAVLLV
jgi:hypothetical protein